MKRFLLVLLLLSAGVPVNGQLTVDNVREFTIFDAELDKDTGTLTLNRFDQTLKISIPDKTPITDSLVASKTELIYDDYKVHVFESEKGIEWDIILSSKPSVNSWSLKTEFSTLEWHYQPPLNEEVWPKGYTVNATHAMEGDDVKAYRPIEYVGSWAVFGNKQDNEYGTGKFCHVQRPLVYDQKGNKIYGDLSYSNGVLTVTVDEAWLENAVYPVTVDPVFEEKSVGASSAEYYFHSTVYSQTKTLSEDGDITAISAYVTFETEKTLKAALYSISGGVPDTNLINGSDVSISVAAWYHWNVSSTSLTAGDYGLALGDGGTYSDNQM